MFQIISVEVAHHESTALQDHREQSKHKVSRNLFDFANFFTKGLSPLDPTLTHLLHSFALTPTPHRGDRVGTAPYGAAPPTEPYLCCSHTALQDDRFSPLPPAGLRPPPSCKQRLLRGLRFGQGSDCTQSGFPFLFIQQYQTPLYEITYG